MKNIALPRLLLLLLFVVFSARAHSAAPSPLGLWETADKDAVVELYACEGTEVCGRFYWLKDDSAENPSRDDKNPDAALRQRPLCGLTFIGGFTEKKDGFYEGGWLYSPRHGSTFSARLHLIDADTLELRGYVFFSFLGGGQTWHRRESSQRCPLYGQNVAE